MKSIGKQAVNKVLLIYFAIFYVGYNIILSNLLSVILDNGIFLYIQLFAEFLVFLIIILLTKQKIKEDYHKIDNYKPRKLVFTVVGYHFLMNTINIAVNLIILQFATVETSNNQLGIEMMFEKYPIYIVITAVIFAPIVEELVFRGTIYAHMRQKIGFLSCALINSFIFAGLHFTISLLTGDFSDIIFIFSYMAQSFIICLIYEKTDNIIMPIVLHFMNNAFAIISMFLI